MPTDEPPLPRLCRDLVLVTTSDGILVEGGTGRHRLRGAGADLLARLMPLLDGLLDAATLCEKLDLTHDQLRQAVRTLDRCGLVGKAGTARARPEVLDYFSRTFRTSGGYRGSAELLNVLGAASVLVIGRPEFATTLADDLRATGIGRVIASEAPHTGEFGLVVVLDEPNRPDLLAETVSRCRQKGIRVLRVAADAHALEIGPQFWPPYTACAECLRRGRADLGWVTDEPTGEAAWPVLAGLVAAEVVNALARTDQPASPRSLNRLPLDTLSGEPFLVAPYPDCPSCAGPDGVAATYEWQMEWLHDDLDSHPTQRPTEVERISGLQTARAVPDHLPAAVLPADTPTPASAMEFLANILVRTAGFQDGDLHRWAPSGGNLASVECYVVTDRHIVDLPGTVFRYDDLRHGLCAVRADRVPVADFLAGTDLAAADHDTVLALVAGVRRLGGKYGSFASRLAHLDAGCAAMQLLAVTAGHGLPVRFADRWGARQAELLELEPGGELITAIVGFGRFEEQHADHP